jgi:CRP-like cAMP-binding protein
VEAVNGHGKGLRPGRRDPRARPPVPVGLPRTDLQRIARLMKPRTLGADEFPFREGDAGDWFYVAFDGAVEILKERPLGDHEL